MDQQNLTEQQIARLLESASRFPPPPGVRFSYGTAGFRADGSLLASTVFRTGLLAALRSLKTGASIGLVITASHNPVRDNGVKVADPSGGMLTQQWEPFADALANAQSPDELVQLILEFVKKEDIRFGGSCSAEVLLARDTRPSGEALLDAAKQGISAIMGAVALDMGILTTPQLHWMVRQKNMGLRSSELDYYSQLAESFSTLVDLSPSIDKPESVEGEVLVDAANGVGGIKLVELQELLPLKKLGIRNSGEGVLNEGVGADYVQKEKVVPQGFGSNDAGSRCVSLDGDADRLVYFQVDSARNDTIDLVDGDKILSLFAIFIREQISIINGDGRMDGFPVNLGIVQTAYANGASTKFLKGLGLNVVFTPTGVKYLHEKASEYDIGIYFEANGHGTVLFSESFLNVLESKIHELSTECTGPAESESLKAALRLLAVSQLINQAVGDALSGLLLVEAILHHLGYSIQTWSELYNDLPSRQLKVKVIDRTVVTTTNAETLVVQPAGLQELIDSETAKHPCGRCFIRPSGTEDVIRVYAEASTQEAADTLARSVMKIVDRVLGFGGS